MFEFHLHKALVIQLKLLALENFMMIVWGFLRHYVGECLISYLWFSVINSNTKT
jgi:hypothetical protein